MTHCHGKFSIYIETESKAKVELDVTPTTNVIQFLLRDEVGTLANALQIFDVSYKISIA